MSELTLDEAIKHCLEVAEHNEMLIKRDYAGGCNSHDCSERAANHRQLAKWLREFKEAKRLLKLAVEDLSNNAAETYNGGVFCKSCKWLTETVYCKCPNDGGCDIVYQWRYLDDALKLIKEE